MYTRNFNVCRDEDYVLNKGCEKFFMVWVCSRKSSLLSYEKRSKYYVQQQLWDYWKKQIATLLLITLNNISIVYLWPTLKHFFTINISLAQYSKYLKLKNNISTIVFRLIFSFHGFRKPSVVVIVCTKARWLP